jgi:hypothetical protein
MNEHSANHRPIYFGLALLAATLVMSPPGTASARIRHASHISLAAARANPVAGRWQRKTKCTELVTALQRAGLQKYVLDAVAGNGFIPGVNTASAITDPTHPCTGAVPRQHSHLFTADGQFSSRNWQGEQVDDGAYRIIDKHTLVILKEFPKVLFHYRVSANTLTLVPVLPKPCITFRCAWAISMAYPGHSFTRT